MVIVAPNVASVDTKSVPGVQFCNSILLHSLSSVLFSKFAELVEQVTVR